MTYTHMRGKQRPVDVRFWEKVDKSEGCWLWTASIAPRSNGNGSGTFWDGQAWWQAHRWSYTQLAGPIPDGLELDHLCFEPRCVRPDHLEPVDRLTNQQRHGDRITHCPQGHEYTEANTYIRDKGNGRRQCRRCHADREAQRRSMK